MPMRVGGRALREIRTLFDWGTVGSWSDGQLLAEIVTDSEGREAAIRAVIDRHGPMVLGVCRRILGDDDAAEDAFQATFLVLIRRADALRDLPPLAGWLHGVARRVASKERVRAARRRDVERRARAIAPAGLIEDVERDELRSLIDEEVGRLPERYRLPVILCYLEGLRHDEAARRLGCPVGTVESRLSRARERLRARLTRRGLSPTESMIGLALGPMDASATLLTSSLGERTLRAAVGLAAAPTGMATGLVRRLGRTWMGAGPAVRAGLIASTLVGSAGLIVLASSILEAPGPPPARGGAAPLAKSKPTIQDAPARPAVVQKAAQTRDEPVRPPDAPAGAEAPAVPSSTPEKAATKERLKPMRESFAYIPPITGIRIDGQLEDWPPAIPRYPIDRLLDLDPMDRLGNGGLRDANLSTSADLSAAFQAGYDPRQQLLYLAVIVRDDKLVIGHSSHLDTDALEVYIDGLHGERRLLVGDEAFRNLDLANVPVQQYIAIPGKGMIYGVRQASNPILMAGSLKQTKTRMAFVRKGDVTTYEWAIQVFDRYPDRPTKLEPGRRIGFDVAVVDKDAPSTSPGGYGDPAADRTAWIFWGPFWRGNKMLDAGSLGELILVK